MQIAETQARQCICTVLSGYLLFAHVIVVKVATVQTKLQFFHQSLWLSRLILVIEDSPFTTHLFSKMLKTSRLKEPWIAHFRSQGNKKYIMPNSYEHEIYPTLKC